MGYPSLQNRKTFFHDAANPILAPYLFLLSFCAQVVYELYSLISLWHLFMPCVPHPPDRVYLKHHAHHRSISHPCGGISLGSGDSSYLLVIHLDHKFSCLKKISHNTQSLVSYSVANMCWGQVWIVLWLEWVITPGNPASVSIKV